MKDPLVFVMHMRDAICLIEDFLNKESQKVFFQDKLLQSGVVRQIEIIGEAAKNVPLEFKNKYPAVPWKDIAGMRDKIIHSYFEVDLEKVWLVTQNDMKKLNEQIERIIKENS